MGSNEGSFSSLNSQGFHRVVYREWGPADGFPVICVHGLTGNSHDFDWIAPELAQTGYRVLAIDMPGRGGSDFLPNALDYNYAQYLKDLTAFMAHVGIKEPGSTDWIGVSMGGLLGMRLACLPGTPIRNMVLNDIGPYIPQADIDFIAQYISRTYAFDTLAEMEAFMRQTRGLSWGPITDSQWAQMAQNNARAMDDGRLTYRFDPRIADVFAAEPAGDVDMWSCWDATQAQVLALRGDKSTIFPQKTADEMLTRGPGAAGKMALEIIEGCGHVPSLMAPDQIRLVRNWLLSAASA